MSRPSSKSAAAVATGSSRTQPLANGMYPEGSHEDTMFGAACFGDLKAVKKQHITHGIPVDLLFAGAPLMIHACFQNHLHIMKFLHERGADVNQRGIQGANVISVACVQNRLHIAKWLCEKGANLNVSNDLGRTALHLAAREGHLEMVKWLCEHGANADAITRDGNNETPVDTARQGRKLNGKIARVMTKQSEAQSAQGRVCVKVVGSAAGKPISVHRSNLRTGDEASCAVCNKSDCELKACGICREMGLPRIYYCSRECQEEDWKKHKKVHKMAKGALTVPVSEEMRKRAEITLAVKPDHASVLWVAAESGDLEMCAALIDCGVDPDGVDAGGSPLHVACGSCGAETADLAIATLLVSHGAKLNEGGSLYGHTPLGTACGYGLTAIVEMLLKNGADANMAAAAPGLRAGHTPLLATRMCVVDPKKCDKITKLLLANGATPLSADEKQELKAGGGRPVPE
eukprot:g1430.t1